jgi:hypothetical protein
MTMAPPLLSRHSRRHGRLAATAIALLLGATAPCLATEALVSRSGGTVGVLQQAQAQAFWDGFRAATARADWAALAGMATQPLLLRGEVDGVAPRKVTADKAAAVLRTQFGQTLFAGKGKPALTVAAWVDATPVLLKEHWLAPDQFRVQNLAFRKEAGGWKLAAIYDEEL